MAAVGPPPGLGRPAGPPADSKPATHHQTDENSNHLPGRLTAGTGPRYARSFLLKLASSPLIPEQPAQMPPLAHWFGDWEPYTPKPHHTPHHQYHQHGAGNNNAANLTGYGQGPRGNRDREGGTRQHHHHHQRADEGMMGEFKSEGSGMSIQSGYLPGFQGVRRREGERDTRSRRPDDRDLPREYADGSRYGPNGANNSRFTTGKNPFGQVSASGTFRPAGKDPDALAGGRFTLNKAFGRERDHDDGSGNLRPSRMGGPGGRRRNQLEEGEEETGEWETVPRSPESERKLAKQAGGLADAAADWRRGTGTPAGPPGLTKRGVDGPRATRKGEEFSARRGVPSGSFPAWMAEESEPSWMNDEGSSPSNNVHTSEKRERGKLNFDAFKGSENIHVTPRDGEDSIQAFKREMKERERRAREQEAGSTSESAAPPTTDVDNEATIKHQTIGPPPGLSRLSQQDDASASDEAHKTDGESNRAQPQESVTPSSSGIADRQPSSVEPSPAATSSSSTRGSSRFARFFDGAAATNKAKEAQERALAALSAQHAANTGQISPAATPSTGPTADSNTPSNAGLDALFKQMSVASPKSATDASSKSSAMQRQPSEADVEGMQKIMAMLRGGGGGGGGGGGVGGSASKDESSAGKESDIASPSSQAAAAGLMAMLGGGGRPRAQSPSVSQPPSEVRSSGPEQMQNSDRLSSPQRQSRSGPQQGQGPLPPGLGAAGFDPRVAGSTGHVSPSTHMMAARSHSPGISFQQQSNMLPFGMSPGMPPGYPGSPASPDPRSVQSRPPMPPFGGGIDSRMLANRPPPPGLGTSPGPPPQFAGLHSGAPPGQTSTPPPGSHRGESGNGGAGPPLSNAGGLLAGLPPHIQHQLMGLPPHVQHSILTNGGPLPPPPPGPLSPHQFGGNGQPGMAHMGLGPRFVPGGPASPGGMFGQRPFPGGPPQHVGPYAQPQPQQPQQHQQGQGGGGMGGMPPMHNMMFGGQGGR